jgi:hypothetical protein
MRGHERPSRRRQGTEWSPPAGGFPDSPETDYAEILIALFAQLFHLPMAGADGPSETTGAHRRISSVETYPALLFSLKRPHPLSFLIRSSLRLSSNLGILSSKRLRLAPKPLQAHKCVFALRGGPQFHMT